MPKKPDIVFEPLGDDDFKRLTDEEISAMLLPLTDEMLAECVLSAAEFDEMFVPVSGEDLIRWFKPFDDADSPEQD